MVTWISIADLRPTQLTLGFEAVAMRKIKLVDKTDAELREHLSLERRRVPHVIGPDGELYMTDHHHLARALWEMGKTEVALGKTIADLSHLEPTAFWHEMDARSLCWPVDAEGNRRPYSAIPRHIGELGDNAWRSLARRVVDVAFDNDTTAFQEFMWGEYFRSFMSRRLIEEQPALAAKLAIEVAALPDAEDLPGFRGRHR